MDLEYRNNKRMQATALGFSSRMMLATGFQLICSEPQKKGPENLI